MFQLRSRKNPKGPSMSQARHIKKDLGIARLAFMAPAPSPRFDQLTILEGQPDSVDALDTSIYTRQLGTNNRYYPNYMQKFRAYNNEWKFNGFPIIEGACGDISLVIDVIRIDDCPVNESFFNKSNFAMACLADIKYSRADIHTEPPKNDIFNLTPQKWPDYLGPINSQWIKKSNTDWLYYEFQPLVSSSLKIIWATPLTDQHFILFSFSISRSCPNNNNAYREEEPVPRKNFLDYIHKFMDTVEIELQPEFEQKLEQQKKLENEAKPVIEATPEHIALAKTVMHEWSDCQYKDPSKDKEEDHRAPFKDVSDRIDWIVTPKPIPGSYPRGELIYNHAIMEKLKQDSAQASMMQTSLESSTNDKPLA
ncbi:hypothetical protein [Thalassolituus sp.]|jgi:hypothetical protein|uniref:hypothetical protein n=1 Tax=Thalassolituus sp. TaxID=2030822 RepID=UPI002A7F69AD|nr:hypothetical protein [Thalassolituus sp.]